MKSLTKFFVTGLLFACLNGHTVAQSIHKFPRGCYRTINQLLHDSVQLNSGCEVFVKSESSRYTEYVIYNELSKKRIKPVFAYSDGDTVYLSQQFYRDNNCYTRSLELGRYLYFEDLYYNKGNTAVIGFGIAFGLIGVAMAVGVRGLYDEKGKPIDFSGVREGRVCGIIVDTQTGYIRGVCPENFNEVFASYPLLVEKFNNSDRTLADIRKCVRELNSLN